MAKRQNIIMGWLYVSLVLIGIFIDIVIDVNNNLNKDVTLPNTVLGKILLFGQYNLINFV
jgi:hypothetical protein